MHHMRLGAWIISSVVLTSLHAEGDEGAAERPLKPAHSDGKSDWFDARVEQYKVHAFDSECVTKFGGGMVNRVPGSKTSFTCAKSLEKPPGLATALKTAISENRTLPPSKQKDSKAVWEAVWRAAPNEERPRCPEGMTLDAATPRLECRATLTQICPKGTDYSDGMDKCANHDCPEGYTDLETVTGGKTRGCFKCPAGELDFKETLAKYKTDVEASQRVHLQHRFSWVLCRAPSGGVAHDKKTESGDADH